MAANLQGLPVDVLWIIFSKLILEYVCDTGENPLRLARHVNRETFLCYILFATKSDLGLQLVQWGSLCKGIRHALRSKTHFMPGGGLRYFTFKRGAFDFDVLLRLQYKQDYEKMKLVIKAL
jgi:hypothetical protein